MNSEVGAQDSLASEISLILGAKAVIDNLNTNDPEAPNTALWAMLTVAPRDVVNAYFEASERSNVPGWYRS